MLALSSVIFQRVVEVLLPHMETEETRRGLLAPVFSNSPLYYQLNCSGDPQSCTVRLVETLAHYGEIQPGKQALPALLEYVCTTVGIDEQQKIDLLLHALESASPPNSLPSDQTPSPSTTLAGASPGQLTMLRPGAAAKNNLPVALTTFVGREHELAQITKSLTKTHLLTLTGAAGCGKTRLASEAARNLLPTFTDGVWLVELAGLSDPQEVPQAVAAVFGVHEEMMRPLLATLTAHLQDKHVLLILDNCERLIQSCARVIATLLQAAPRLWVLVTSRDILNIEGEALLEVPPLTLPEGDGKVLMKRLPQYAAIQLFVDRAQAIQSDFTLTARNVLAIAKICRQLDGLPLAIELAAACLKLFTADEIAARLDARFQLLIGGSRVALPHHRTLRAAMNWSYELLNDKERALFNRLSVFAGGFALEAAVTVAGGEHADEYQIIEWLSSLIEKSLVQVEKMADGSVRYRLLETLCQYGHERLEETGLERDVRNRHFGYYLTLAEQAEPALRGPQQTQWLDRLRVEHDNLRAALKWVARIAQHETTPEGEWLAKSLRLASALCRFWKLQGYFNEGRRWLAQLLSLPSTEKLTTLRAQALNSTGALAEEQGDYNAAQTFYAESLAIWRQLNDPAGIAEALNDLGKVATFQGDYSTAQSLCEESLSIRRMLGDRWGIAVLQTNLGNIARYQGDYQAAQALYKESLGIFRQIDDKWATAVALNNLGLVAMKQHDFGIARTYLEDSLAIDREIQDQQGIAYAFQNLGELSYRCGDWATARQMHTQGLEYCTNLGDKEGIATALASFALLAQSRGETVKAVQLFAAAAALRSVINAPLASDETREQAEFLTILYSGLGDAAYSVAWNAGQAMTWQDAVTLALAEEPPS